MPHLGFTVLLTKNPKVLIENSISTLGFTKVKTAILPSVYTLHIYKQTDFHSQKALRMQFAHIPTCGLTMDQSHQECTSLYGSPIGE